MRKPKLQRTLISQKVVALIYMYPDADIPVVPVSIDARATG